MNTQSTRLPRPLLIAHRNYFRPLALLALLVPLLLAGLSRAADLASDQGDYSPGRTAIFTGSGFQPDETVTLRYSQTGTDRTAGLTVADRPDASIAAAARLNDAKTDEERAKLRQELVDSGVVGSKPRAFVGKDRTGTAKLTLSDGDGKPRLVLSVDRAGAARVEFHDAAGKVTRAIQP